MPAASPHSSAILPFFFTQLLQQLIAESLVKVDSRKPSSVTKETESLPFLSHH